MFTFIARISTCAQLFSATLDTSSRCISLRLQTVSNRFIQSSKINRRYKRCTGFFARRVVFLVPVFHPLPFHYQILVPLSTPHAPCNYTVLSVQLHTQIPLIIGPVLIKNIGESGRSVWCAVPTAHNGVLAVKPWDRFFFPIPRKLSAN